MLYCVPHLTQTTILVIVHFCLFSSILFGYIHAAERAVPVSFESALNTAWPTISHQLICTLFSTFYGDAVAIFTKGTVWYAYIPVEWTVCHKKNEMHNIHVYTHNISQTGIIIYIFWQYVRMHNSLPSSGRMSLHGRARGVIVCW